MGGGGRKRVEGWWGVDDREKGKIVDGGKEFCCDGDRFYKLSIMNCQFYLTVISLLPVSS